MKRKKEKPQHKAAVTVSGVDLGEVERLLEFMAQHGLDEFEYERAGARIRLRKAASNSNLSAGGALTSRRVLPPEIVVAGSASAAEAPPPEAASAGEVVRAADKSPAVAEDLHIEKSPIVGTFYGVPSPGAEPFIRIGDHVEAGQVLCIIEAMKLMNEIESGVAGEVLRIYVENGQPVEYGEPLFGIRPSRKK